MRLLLVMLAGAALVAGCSGETPNEQRAAAINEANAAAVEQSRSVSFELADLSGTMRQSGEWDGKPKLLNFWATWCAPCRREIPLLKKTQDEYAELDLQVIGIAVDFAEDVAAYAEEADFNYPILVGQEDAMAVAEDSGVDFIGLPFTMVVASSGELIKAHIGEIKEEHIVQITDVVGAFERGELDLDAAREQLRKL